MKYFVGTLFLSLILSLQASAITFKKDAFEYEAKVGERFFLDMREMLDSNSKDVEWAVLDKKQVPAWLQINIEVEMMLGVPTETDMGSTKFLLAARDAESGAIATISIRVNGDTDKPISLKETEIYSKSLVDSALAIHLDDLIKTSLTGQAIEWKLSGDVPAFVHLEKSPEVGTSLVSEPLKSEVGDYSFNVIAIQGEYFAMITIHLAVVSELENRAPVWFNSPKVVSSLSLGTVCAGSSIAVDLNQFVVDPDGDALSFFAARNSYGVSANLSEAGLLSIHALKDAKLAIYGMTLAATDGKDSSIARFSAQVIDCPW